MVAVTDCMVVDFYALTFNQLFFRIITVSTKHTTEDWDYESSELGAQKH